MSRGPGRIERAIADILDAEPDNAFTVEDLCRRVYGIERVEKKHRVAVLRAAATLGKRRDTLCWTQSDPPGATCVYYNIDNVMSYAMARLKAEDPYEYGTTCRKTEADLRAKLAKGGNHHKDVVRGGAWWRHTQQHIAQLKAKRSGNTRLLAKLRREHAAKNEAIMGKYLARIGASAKRLGL